MRRALTRRRARVPGPVALLAVRLCIEALLRLLHVTACLGHGLVGDVLVPGDVLPEPVVDGAVVRFDDLALRCEASLLRWWACPSQRGRPQNCRRSRRAPPIRDCPPGEGGNGDTTRRRPGAREVGEREERPGPEQHPPSPPHRRRGDVGRGRPASPACSSRSNGAAVPTAPGLLPFQRCCGGRRSRRVRRRRSGGARVCVRAVEPRGPNLCGRRRPIAIP